MQQSKLQLKIAITGPESTGKSTLTESLANYYNTFYVPEYAREYIDALKRPYLQEDILVIAQKQEQLFIDQLKLSKNIIFSDTELLVTYIWSMHAFGKADDWIINHLNQQQFDLYLLCDIDLPWTFDEQREHPHLRKFFFDWYFNELCIRNLPFVVISGAGDERIQNAIDAINSKFFLIS